ncbi:MAG: hypothetical protein ABFS32_18385 [Bacteroidota bacterium]
MQKERKIVLRIDSPAPPAEDIRRHKNFGKFVDQFYHIYTPSGFRWMLKNNIKKLVLIVILAILLLLWYLGEL